MKEGADGQGGREEGGHWDAVLGAIEPAGPSLEGVRSSADKTNTMTAVKMVSANTLLLNLTVLTRLFILIISFFELASIHTK